jgi:precorrin-6A/cobalt-precorrin-6A reductase
MRNILILGGTTEATALAQALAQRGDTAVLSYAGRVETPRAQPVPVRTGGFGGVAGLTEYLRINNVTHLVDATHPFAATMSENAVVAAREAGVPLVALTRPAWQPVPGDNWRSVPDIPSAVQAVAGESQRVFLALGRMHLAEFAAQPQHHYVLRLVDPPLGRLPLPQTTVIVSRGPFRVADDTGLMREHRIELVVCKNAGGDGASAKLAAARGLGIPVLMIDRPVLPPRREMHEVAEVLRWLDHSANLGV